MIVIDSSFLIAFHNASDVHHASARAAMLDIARGRWGEALLLEYVFLEVVTVVRALRDLATALAVGASLLDSREFHFVPCSDLFLAALDQFRNQAKDALSFTDAAIVAAARENEAHHIATYDRGFATVDGIELVPAPAGAPEKANLKRQR